MWNPQRLYNYLPRVVTQSCHFSHLTPFLKSLHCLAVKYIYYFSRSVNLLSPTNYFHHNRHTRQQEAVPFNYHLLLNTRVYTNIGSSFFSCCINYFGTRSRRLEVSWSCNNILASPPQTHLWLIYPHWAHNTFIRLLTGILNGLHIAESFWCATEFSSFALKEIVCIILRLD